MNCSACGGFLIDWPVANILSLDKCTDQELVLRITSRLKEGGSLFELFSIMRCDNIDAFVDENTRLLNYIKGDFHNDDVDAIHLNYNLMLLIVQLQKIEEMVAVAMNHSSGHKKGLENIIKSIENLDEYGVPDYEGFGQHFSKSKNKKLKDLAPKITEHFNNFHKLLALMKRTINIMIKAEDVQNGVKHQTTKTYTSRSLNFTIDYPASWRVKEEGWMVAFGSPQESDTDDFIENVNVVVEDLSNNLMTLKDYNAMSLMNFPKLMPNFELLQEDTAEINGKGASFIVYSDRRGDVKAKFKAYTFISKDKAYVVTYAAKENEFNEYLPQAEKIMQSIQVF